MDANPDFDFARARKTLLHWFKTNGRNFPWREEPTPYRVWVSEIMLQQTTTQTVLGYFDRFLTRFPNVQALASASEEETLKYWEGLGYYRRAKALREAAQIIVERYNGEFPERYDDVLSLPGVGRYASGAILSFGYDKRFAILEANTTRLHARLLALREETTRANAQKILWRFAEDWLPPESKRRAKNVYRNINAALTDLGRLVCSPAEPRCDSCPLREFCETDRLGLQTQIPVLRKKVETIKQYDAALWISRGDLVRADRAEEYRANFKDSSVDVADDLALTCSSRDCFGPETDVLLIRRREGALWSGLWDFPRFEIASFDRDRLGSADSIGDIDIAELDLSLDTSLSERVQYFLEEESGALANDYRVGPVLTTVRHSVTRYRVELSVCRLRGAKTPVKTRNSTPLLELADGDEERKTRSLQIFHALNVQNGGRRRCIERQAAELKWVPISSLNELPLSSPARRVANFIVKSMKESCRNTR